MSHGKNGLLMVERIKAAAAQGQAFDEALKLMRKQAESAQVYDGDLIVSLACEEAEGMYELRGGVLVWQAPAPEENQHVEIVVQDREDHRFVPGLTVECDVIDDSGAVVAKLRPQFIWHPFLFHYGANCALTHDGDHSFVVRIAAPSFPRHGKDREFAMGPLPLRRGRKPHGPE